MNLEQAMENAGSINSRVYIGVMCDADLSHEGNMRETTMGEFQDNVREMEEVEEDHIRGDIDPNADDLANDNY